MDIKILVCQVQVYYGDKYVIKDVDVDILDKIVIVFIGLLGCGKLIFLCCLNCMNDIIESCCVEGKIMLDGEDIYDKCVDLVQLCVKVGMVFQKLNLFFKLIYDNVFYGFCIYGLVCNCVELDEIVEQLLCGVVLWNEVKDRLNELGIGLLGGQQQCLCIVCVVVIQLEVLLMDEFCLVFDLIVISQVEELIDQFWLQFLVVIVMYLMQQVVCVSQKIVFFYLGNLVEYNDMDVIFICLQDLCMESYILGCIG